VTPRHERASPRLGARELAGLALGACAVSLAMGWHVVRGLRSAIPGDPHDPFLQSWEIAWGGHALLHQPFDYFQANMFWPFRNTLAFSDALAGYAPFALLGHGTEAALVRYNVLFLLAYALASAGAYLLARELGARPAAAAVAGAAFAFAPWRIAHVPHLNLLSSGGIPLALFLLVRGYRGRSPRTVLGGWLVASWQVSLGWNLGLPFLYVLAFLAAVAAIWWLVRGRPEASRALFISTAAGVAALLAVSAVLARPYFAVLEDHPEAKRSKDVVAFWSPPVRSLLAAPADSLVWGAATRGIREQLRSPEEQAIFPGAAVLALALLGVAAPGFSGRVRAALVLAAVVAGVFSLGYGIRGSSFTYDVLYDYFPGWQGLRTPGRLATFTSLALALLAAAGAHFLLGAAGGRRRARLAVPALGAVLLAALLVEGYGRFPHPRVPDRPAALTEATAPLLQLPFGSDFDAAFLDEGLYLFWSIDGFPALVNGASGFAPASYYPLADRMERFPDTETVQELRALGVRTVVLHTDLARGTAWERAATRSVEGLPLTRQEAGSAVLYRITPE